MNESCRESSVCAFTGSFVLDAAEAAKAAIANAARSDGAAARDRAKTRKPLSRARRATTSAARVACKTTRSDSFAVEPRIESIVSSKESNRVDNASSTRRRTSSRSSSSESPNAISPSALSAAAIDSGGTSSTGRLAAATSAETSGDGECAGTISTSPDMLVLVHAAMPRVGLAGSERLCPAANSRRQSRDVRFPGTGASVDSPAESSPMPEIGARRFHHARLSRVLARPGRHARAPTDSTGTPGMPNSGGERTTRT